MDRRIVSWGLVLGLGLAFTGCGKDAATKICLEDFEKFTAAAEAKDGKAGELAGSTYQTCGISCDVTQDEDACQAFQSVTESLCRELGKEACADLCNQGKGNDASPEKNEHACKVLESL